MAGTRRLSVWMAACLTVAVVGRCVAAEAEHRHAHSPASAPTTAPATQEAFVDGQPVVRHAVTFPVEAPDLGSWVVSLNGTWQFAPESETDFQPAPVPGFWGASAQAKAVGFKVAGQWKSGTYRRDFQMPAEKTGALLTFGMLRWGGQVAVNGQPAGSYDLGHSPVTFDLANLVKQGGNRLEVRCTGWAGLPRHEGDIQIPVGAGNWFGIKDGGIPDDVDLYLYKGAWLDSLVVSPRLASMSCNIVTRVGAGAGGWQGQVAAQILTLDGKTAVSQVQRKSVRVQPDGTADVQITGLRAPDGRGWYPESPLLYRVVVWLEGADKTVAAARGDTFGFRDVRVGEGRVLLNGRPVRMFGATELVMYSMLRLLDDPANLKRVQVDLFRAMNGTAFRSHMNPLPRSWLDLCDRYGVLVIPEFPNFPDVQRTNNESPYELPDYWKNLQREARGIVAYRNNHPSVVGWSVSNEGSGFGDWERRHLVPYVKAIDPGRFVMLSGDITPEVADQHNFAGMWWGTFGEFQRVVDEFVRFYPTRVRGCTEYGQYSGGKRWYGPREVTGQSAEFEEDHARILMEQTESLRRARFNLIMPYSYGGNWFGKKAGETGQPADATARYHALRNGLAPLGVSFESTRHGVAGATLAVPLWLYSDFSETAGECEVALYLLDRHPGYDWNGQTEGFKVLAHGSYRKVLEAWQAYHEDVSIALPGEPGTYWLAATVRQVHVPGIQAVSLKQLRLYRPVAKPESRLAVGVIERDGRLARWLRNRGHRVVLAFGDQTPDVIVFSEGCLYDERVRTWGASMTGRIKAGTRLVVLEQGNWDAPVMQSDISKILTGLTAAPCQTSLENLFVDAALAGSVGVDRDFQRLNGLDNVAMRVGLVPAERAAAPASQPATQPGAGGARLTPEAQAGAAASQPGVWRSLIDGYGLRGDKPGWALATRMFEAGRVLACQVPLLGRVDAADASQFDPVAERLLAFLIEGKVP